MFCPSVSTLSLGPPTKWRGNTNGSVEIMRTRHVDVDVDVDLPPGVVAGLHTAPLHPQITSVDRSTLRFHQDHRGKRWMRRVCSDLHFSLKHPPQRQ